MLLRPDGWCTLASHESHNLRDFRVTHSRAKGLYRQSGLFLEIFNQTRYHEAGLRVDFVQDNLSFSGLGTLRGLHFQNPNSQGKLLQVLQGEVFDVAVDIRRSSPTFGQWHALVLSEQNK